MTLDDATVSALGYGDVPDVWRGDAFTFRRIYEPTPELRAQKAECERRRRRAAGVLPRAKATAKAAGQPHRFQRVYSTEEERRDAERKRKREHMRRVRAARRAA